MGSTREARSAGTMEAASATAESVTAATVKVAGSRTIRRIDGKRMSQESEKQPSGARFL